MVGPGARRSRRRSVPCERASRIACAVLSGALLRPEGRVPAEAANWLNRVDWSLGRLSRFPESGTTPNDDRLAGMGYRVVVIGEYLAFYLIRRNRVEIRRVLHGRRRYGFLL